MKKLFFLFFLLPTVAAAQSGYSGSMDKTDVNRVCNAVAYWQIANHHKVKHNPLDWTNGALYRGMVEWAKTSGNDDFNDFVVNIGRRHGWNMWNRPYHADDITVGQAFIELYRIHGEPQMMRPAMERAFWVASHPSQAPLLKTDPLGKDERWSWCDALFMAPPVYAVLYTMTGERVYLDYMNSEYKVCVDSLYDREAGLFYRDVKRKPLREPNGAKQFWGRGNGWVFGGLPLIISNLPADEPSREYYIDLFRRMAVRLLKLQDADGAWHSSLLDTESYPLPENSASAFFCYGFAWGINNGYLSPDDYKPALERGWGSLVSAVSDEGRLGYIQPVGAAPKATGIEATDVYGVGAFLLAGSEIFLMSSPR